MGQNIQTSDLRAISLDSFKDTKHPALHSFLCGKWLGLSGGSKENTRNTGFTDENMFKDIQSNMFVFLSAIGFKPIIVIKGWYIVCIR